ncbi:MAG: hypothetical protein JO210_17890 [Acidobacteriaceae bacterium]|nr:hypothetical protein [Acidobacteriaceae bacterium]
MAIPRAATKFLKERGRLWGRGLGAAEDYPEAHARVGRELARVEIILDMREKMEAMQRQMEGFVRTLNQELSERAANRPMENSQSLVPVIQINSVSMRSDAKRGPEGPKRGRR